MVTKNELMALKSISDNVTVLSRDDLKPSNYQQPDSPFLYDYFALHKIKDKHFDLAHFYSWTFTQTVHWLKSQGTKVAYTVSAHDRRITVEEFERLGLEYPYPHIKDDKLWQIYSEGIRLADVVITPSQKSAEFLRSEGCRNVIVVPHGTELPDHIKPIPERFRVGYLGALGPDKGLVYLIKAWGLLGYTDAELVIAGSGTELLVPTVRQIAGKGRVALMGRVADVSDFYNACSVYCQPSVVEGFGIEVLEAMAYGRPVVVSEGAGASDLVEDNETGFVVPIRDPQAIATRIDWLKNNPESLIEMGIRAQQKAKMYTWQDIRRGYASILSAL